MALADDLRNLINRSHKRAWNLFDSVRTNPAPFGLTHEQTDGWKTPGEPAFASALLHYTFTSQLAKLIKRHLGPTGLSKGAPIASGVFIHQKPKVKFSRAHIELGDLLIVRQHFCTSSATLEGRAALLQTKANNAPLTGTLAGKELEQFRLYTNWKTPFVFPHGELGSPPNGAKKWNFSLGTMPFPARSGYYGVVSNLRHQTAKAPFPMDCAWAVAQAISKPKTAASVNASDFSLAEGLEGLLLGTWGRPWSATPAVNDHWSHFIQRALTEAVGWTYPVQRLGVTAAKPLPRRRDVLEFARAFSARQIYEAYDFSSIWSSFNLQTVQTEENLLGEFNARVRSAIDEHWAFQMDGAPPSSGTEMRERNDSRGGPSVLYIATTGPERLDDINDQQIER